MVPRCGRVYSFVALQGRNMGRETEIPGTEVSAQDKSALPGPPNRVNPERAAVSTAVPSSPAPSLPDEEQREPPQPHASFLRAR